MTTLPYLTEKQLNAPVKAVTLQIWGEARARGEHRKEVITKPYETKIVVPADYNMGHGKLIINRTLRREMGAINARTYYIDNKVKPVPAEGEYKARDFLSDQTLADNEHRKKLYLEEQERIKAGDAEDDNTPVIGAVYDSTVYDEKGLPPLSKRMVAV